MARSVGNCKHPYNYYHGCGLCYDFSILFDRNYKGRKIDSEEEFEVIKAEYVKHMNDKHYDLIVKNMEKRNGVSRKFNIINEPHKTWSISSIYFNIDDSLGQR